MAAMNGFPGGGASVKLKVIEVSAAVNLPASAKEGTLAVITSLGVSKSYAQAAAPTSPVSGAVWVWVGGQSRAPIVLSNYVTMYPRAVYQWTGSAWALRVSYVRVAEVWVELTLHIYDVGADLLAVLSLYNSEAPTRCYIVKETARIFIHMDVVNQDHTNMWISTATTIDLTNVSSIRFNGNFPTPDVHTVGIQRRAGIGSTKNAQAAYAQLPATRGNVTLDVSGYSGLYYINFFFEVWNDGGLQTGYIYEIELVR